MTQSEHELEREMHRELRALPSPRAPATLLPTVLAAAAARPWYRREWLAWPALAQVASAAAMVAIITGLAWLAASATETVGTVSTLVRIGWRLVLEPVVAYVFVLALVIALLIPASWAALTHVALGGTSE